MKVFRLTALRNNSIQLAPILRILASSLVNGGVVGTPSGTGDLLGEQKWIE